MNKILKNFSNSHWPIFIVGNINSLLNLLLPLFLVRIFTPEDMGIYKIFFLYVSSIPFFTMTAGYLTSFYYWAGFKNEFNNYSNSVWFLTFKYSLISLTPMCLLLLLLSHYSSEIKYSYIPLIIISSLLAAPSALYGEYTLASGQTKRSLLLATSFELAKVFGFVFISINYRRMDYIFYFYTLMMITSFFVMNTLAFKDSAFTLKKDIKTIQKVKNYSLPISIGASLSFILEKADQLILSSFLNTKDYAFYAVGCLSIPLIFVLEGSVQKKMLPKISQAFQDQQYDEVKSILKKAIEDIAFLTIPATVGLVYYAKEIIIFLFTKQYLESVIYLQVFSLGYLMYLVPFDSIYRATGKSKELLKFNMFFAILSVIVVLIFALFTTPIAALGASIFIKFFHRIYCFQRSCRIVNINMIELFKSILLFRYFIASFLLIALCFILDSFFENKITAFFINASIFATIYLSYFNIIKKS